MPSIFTGFPKCESITQKDEIGEMRNSKTDSLLDAFATKRKVVIASIVLLCIAMAVCKCGCGHPPLRG